MYSGVDGAEGHGAILLHSLSLQMTWEEAFSTWAQAPSKTEEDKCDNAVSVIQKAIAASSRLANRSMRVFAQGSYRNRTNVRLESDVDVCVVCSETIKFDLADGMTNEDTGLIFPAPYDYPTFRDDVYQALSSYFGAGQVFAGNKAIDVHANTYRVDADVVPCFEHRRYTGRFSCVTPVGARFVARDGTVITNWPQQNYDNGVAKNRVTSQRFKAVVRILKNLRNTMQRRGVAAASGVSSYLIECLVWNAPDSSFGHSTYSADLREVLAHTFNKTLSDEPCTQWGEINELKYLFRTSQPWSRIQAHDFISAAWDHVGFK